MLRKKTICYVLIFDQIDIIKKSLNSLVSFSSELDIVVIENPSNNSDKIRKFVESLGKKGLIKRYYQLDKNITGNAYSVILNNEKFLLNFYKFVVITDGDLLCLNRGWIREEMDILKNKEVFACGVSWDQSNLPLKTFPEAKNWIPEDKSVNEKYFETLTGVHLVMFRSNNLKKFIKYNKDDSFTDGNMHRFCYDNLNKKWARTKHSKAYHLTWDIYADRNHPYTKLKTSKSFRDTWYHTKNSEFKLYKY